VIEDRNTVRLYAGCGVVEGSQPEAELAETWAKFRPMLEALGIGGQPEWSVQSGSPN
jgi:menaquinone-specific isochorismate synthase